MTEVTTIGLNADELTLLADRVKQTEYGTDEQRMNGYVLIKKLAGAWLELAADGSRQVGEVALALTLAECWCLREHVAMADKTATDVAFGMKLLTKLYRAILAFDVPELLMADGGSDRTLAESERAALRALADKETGDG